MKICQRCVVAGIVQGVYYRAATQEQATRLSITGSVRNLPNGDVEVIACGNKEDVEMLIRWLWQGPPRARVEDVTVDELTPADFAGFSVLRD